MQLQEDLLRMYEKQRQQGGIIDTEVEGGDLLITEETRLPHPSPSQSAHSRSEAQVGFPSHHLRVTK